MTKKESADEIDKIEQGKPVQLTVMPNTCTSANHFSGIGYAVNDGSNAERNDCKRWRDFRQIRIIKGHGVNILDVNVTFIFAEGDLQVRGVISHFTSLQIVSEGESL